MRDRRTDHSTVQCDNQSHLSKVIPYSLPTDGTEENVSITRHEKEAGSGTQAKQPQQHQRTDLPACTQQYLYLQLFYYI